MDCGGRSVNLKRTPQSRASSKCTWIWAYHQNSTTHVPSRSWYQQIHHQPFQSSLGSWLLPDSVFILISGGMTPSHVSKEKCRSPDLLKNPTSRIISNSFLRMRKRLWSAMFCILMMTRHVPERMCFLQMILLIWKWSSFRSSGDLAIIQVSRFFRSSGQNWGSLGLYG